jgi:hypothetical protein
MQYMWCDGTSLGEIQIFQHNPTSTQSRPTVHQLLHYRPNSEAETHLIVVLHDSPLSCTSIHPCDEILQ